jgi:hypothetical protein
MPNAITEKGRIEMTTKITRPTNGTGNVFADLGIANPEQELSKARLTLLIHRIIVARRLTQGQAAEIFREHGHSDSSNRCNGSAVSNTSNPMPGMASQYRRCSFQQ